MITGNWWQELDMIKEWLKDLDLRYKVFIKDYGKTKELNDGILDKYRNDYSEAIDSASNRYVDDVNLIREKYLQDSGEVSKQLKGKADIKQGEWITPTMLNGWVDFSVGDTDTQYYKDNFGVVHLKGMCKAGTVGTNFPILILPIGYRPNKTMWVSTVSNNVLGIVVIFSTGNVCVQSGSNNWFSLNNISFRV